MYSVVSIWHVLPSVLDLALGIPHVYIERSYGYQTCWHVCCNKIHLSLKGDAYFKKLLDTNVLQILKQWLANSQF